jgi:hypothetical protein
VCTGKSGSLCYEVTYFRRRLSCTTHSTLSHRQLPHGAPSTTSQRTLRARHETQARAARLLVTLGGPLGSDSDAVRFFDVESGFASGFVGDFATSTDSETSVACGSGERTSTLSCAMVEVG